MPLSDAGVLALLPIKAVPSSEPPVASFMTAALSPDTLEISSEPLAATFIVPPAVPPVIDAPPLPIWACAPSPSEAISTEDAVAVMFPNTEVTLDCAALLPS